MAALWIRGFWYRLRPRVIQSADAGSVNQWISFAHDQTDGNINTGTGGVKINGVLFVPPNFAGVSVDDNSTATTITLADSYFLFTNFDTDMPESISNGDYTSNEITVGATGNYDVKFFASGEPAAGNTVFEYDVFEISSTATSIDGGLTQANPVVVTATGHGLSNGDKCKITGVSTMTEVNDRIFTVAGVSGSSFNLQDDGANNIDGTGFAGAGTGGTVQLATETGVHSHRKYSIGGGGDFGAFSGGNIVNLTVNNTLEFYLKGTTDTTNFTVENVTMYMDRKN
jgi:hypothetical protein